MAQWFLASPVRAAILALLALSGCAARPETAFDAVQPRTAPVRDIGSFNQALRCMNDISWRQGVREIYFTTTGIPDATGLISISTTDCSPTTRGGTDRGRVPPGNWAFDIRFDKAGGHEAVACFTANREIGLSLPDALKRQDLTPLPVRRLDDVAARFRTLGGARMDDARITIEVTQ